MIHFRAINARTGRSLGERIARADTPILRLTGLLDRAGLAQDEGLQLIPCSVIHTFFMRFEIDVAFLDKAGRIVKVFSSLPSRRVAWANLRAHSALELPAGKLGESGTDVGDRVIIHQV